MVYLTKRSFGYHMAVVVCPSTQNGIELFYQHLLRYRLILLEHDFMQLLREPLLAVCGGLD